VKKPKWGKPKLIILTKGKPEEAVLTACKGGGGTSYYGVASGCNTLACGGNCNALAAS